RSGLAFSMVYALVGGTLLTYFLNNWALAYARSSHVALFIYIQPVIAAAIGWYFLFEPITIRMVLSSVLILLGLILGLRGERRSVLSVRTQDEVRTEKNLS